MKTIKKMKTKKEIVEKLFEAEKMMAKESDDRELAIQGAVIATLRWILDKK